jgi:Protein of unknown function (DUF4231)
VRRTKRTESWLASDSQSGMASIDSPAFVRLENEIAWYDTRAEHNRHWFKRLKVGQMATAAGIPVAAAASAPAWLLGGGGALIVVLEGVQQLQHYQQEWTTHRSTCEKLKHEKYLYLARAGPYGTSPSPERRLAERVEGLVTQEHAVWTSWGQGVRSREA